MDKGATGISDKAVARYSRNILVPEVGTAGQIRLLNSSVLCIGAGGLGSSASLYLAAAGVGMIGIVDDDAVDESNLQRQILHDEDQVGSSKVNSAAERITRLNRNVNVVPYEQRLTTDNAVPLFEQYDLVVDGADNFATRYLVNDAAILTQTPYVWGSLFRFDGQASLFGAPRGPCYRCLYPGPPAPGMVPSCAEGGVIGSLCGIVGSIQATEALKWLSGVEGSLVGRLLVVDGRRMTFRTMPIAVDPDCAVCSKTPSVRTLMDYGELYDVGAPSSVPYVTAEDLKDQLNSKGTLLIDVREDHERAISGVIEGSLRLPKSQLDSGQSFPNLETYNSIIVYCSSGLRSAEVVSRLGPLKGVHVRSLKGGIEAWKALESIGDRS